MADDPLSITFAALADPTRRAILARLAEGAATVKELSEPFAMSGPAVSKHLRVLERAGLITRGRDAQWRPCTLDATPLREVTEWADGFRRFWDDSYRRLDTYLEHMKEKGT
ncbi:ArsR/SmtB family transcription factor [Saccharothrix deserti]|uniref:ArsR/SmtB family transcription factor n=1 Tax=Saccharothrix deserti TaxID=2593674 RepID=UPI00131B8EA3|nr:metalloregulator ArsR/SmtB family transcription factor [Saccharothrix deserti]